MSQTQDHRIILSDDRGTTYAGTPAEVGVQIWATIGSPAVAAVAGRVTPAALTELYQGFIAGALGSMTADFGHAQAQAIMQAMLAIYAQIPDELDAPARAPAAGVH